MRTRAAVLRKGGDPWAITGLDLDEPNLGEDGYHLEIAEAGDRVRVTITATAQACADCLVPADMMRGILGLTLGVPEDTIDLAYPLPAEEKR